MESARQAASVVFGGKMIGDIPDLRKPRLCDPCRDLMVNGIEELYDEVFSERGKEDAIFFKSDVAKDCSLPKDTPRCEKCNEPLERFGLLHLRARRSMVRLGLAQHEYGYDWDAVEK